MKMRERMILAGICVMNFIIFLFPWIALNSGKFGFLGILQNVITPGIVI